MELAHELAIDRPLDVVWPVLIDLPVVAQALPGASIEDAESDGTYRGVFRVKLGSFTAAFRGQARYPSIDHDQHRFVLEGSGNSPHGNAVLRVEGRAEDRGEGTSVRLTSFVDLTGRLAQFGSSMAADVTGQLVDAFTDNLARGFASLEETQRPTAFPAHGPGGAVGARRSADTAPTSGWQGESSPTFDLGGTLMPGLRRFAPVAIAAVSGLALGLLMARTHWGPANGRAAVYVVSARSFGEHL